MIETFAIQALSALKNIFDNQLDVHTKENREWIGALDLQMIDHLIEEYGYSYDKDLYPWGLYLSLCEGEQMDEKN